MGEESTRSLRIGFVGLGRQGAPLAQQIIAAGFSVTLFDRQSPRLEPFSGVAKVSPSIEALATESDVIGVCVADDEQVVDVVSGSDSLLSGAAPGTVIAIHNTVHPATCEVLARVAATQGVHVIDAPVGPSAGAPTTERVAVIAAGPTDAVDRCRPVFASFADAVVHVGGPGLGMKAALLASVLMTANSALVDDAIEIATGMGLDRAQFVDALLAGGGSSSALSIYDDAGSLAAIALRCGDQLPKDLGIARRVADGGDATDALLFAAASQGLAAGEL